MTSAPICIHYAGPEDTAELFNFSGLLNCRVSRSQTGEECLEKLRENMVDILIVDLGEQPKEQFALLNEIHELSLGRHMHVFVLTNEPLISEHRILCIRAGATHIMQKPLEHSEFALLIENCYVNVARLKALDGQVKNLSRESQMLGKYLSTDIKDHLLTNRLIGDEKGIRTICSVLCFEIRGGTEIAAQMAPDLYAGFLSTVFEGITALVYANHGSVSRYVGNGVVATFGYPVFYNNDVYNAVKCALEVRNFVAGYNENRPIHITEPIKYGIGISTGEVFAGHVGSSYRKEHLVVGETVNCAARLQLLTRQADVDLLIDDESFDALRESLDAKRVRFNNPRDKFAELQIHCVLNMKANAPVATALTEAELASTYANKVGDVEFF